MKGFPVTLWCSLYCEGNEAVGDMNIRYSESLEVSLPLCQECAEKLQRNPKLALDLKPVDVLELDEDDDLGNLGATVIESQAESIQGD